MELSNIVVTGASGFIGSRVSQTIAEKFPDSKVIGLGRKTDIQSSNAVSNYEYLVCDLMESNFSDNLPDKADVVIHLAGDRRTFVKPYEYTSQTVANVLMTSNVADFAFNAKAKLFIYASSVYLYSGNSSSPFREDYVALPGENLGASKLASEALLKARAVAGHFNALSFRIGTVYGPGSSPEQFIPQAIHKLRSSDPSAKFGASDVKRDFVFIDDVASAFTAAVGNLLKRDFSYEALNLGTDIATSIRDVVQILADEIGSDKLIEFKTGNQAVHQADTDHQLDLARIKAVLGWQPATALREGLRRTINSFTFN